MLVGNQVINDLPNDVYQKEGAAFQIFAQQDTVSLEIKAVNSFSDDSQFIFKGLSLKSNLDMHLMTMGLESKLLSKRKHC